MARTALFIAMLALFCGAFVNGETVTVCACSSGCSSCVDLPDNSCVRVRGCQTDYVTQYWKVTDSNGDGSTVTMKVCGFDDCTACNTARQTCDNRCYSGFRLKCPSSGASVGGIVGGIIGAICCYAIIGLIIFCVMRSRRRSNGTFVSVSNNYGTPAGDPYKHHHHHHDQPQYSGGLGQAVYAQNNDSPHHHHHHHSNYQ